MKSHETTIKIRYGETDQMGYAHPAYFAMYFEESRMELLRDMGINYRELEESGVIMPTISLQVSFMYPVFFDDLLEVKTTLSVISQTRLLFNHLISNQKSHIICNAQEILILLDKKSHKPIKIQDCDLINTILVK